MGNGYVAVHALNGLQELISGVVADPSQNAFNAVGNGAFPFRHQFLHGTFVQAGDFRSHAELFAHGHEAHLNDTVNGMVDRTHADSNSLAGRAAAHVAFIACRRGGRAGIRRRTGVFFVPAAAADYESQKHGNSEND